MCLHDSPANILLAAGKSAKRKRDDLSESSVDWDTDSDAPSNQQQDGRVQVTDVGTREENAEAGAMEQHSAEFGITKPPSSTYREPAPAGNERNRQRSTCLGTSSLKRVKYS